MKILKVELQNINSLRTDVPIVIDFESEAFMDVGLYAITGPTGAGKTTILDAITIGLYRNVPRFQGGSSKAKLEDVVSYGADGAFVNITFENKQERFEAHWSIRLKSKSTGKKLGTPNEAVRLKNLSSGKILSEKKQEMLAEVERITQLSYSQFLRSVMLAQGQFAAFLSANANEKGALLEQITGEEIYKRIGEIVGQKIYDEKNTLGRIRSEINERDLLTKDELTNLKAASKTIAVELKNDKALQLNFQKRVDWFKNLRKLNSEEAENQQNLTLVSEEKEQYKEELMHLAAHEKAAPLQNLINELKRVEKERGIKENTFIINCDDLKVKTDKLVQAEKQLNTAKLKYESAENTGAEWSPKLEKVAQLDTQITNSTETSSKLETQLSTLKEVLEVLSKEKEDVDKRRVQHNKALTEIDAFLQEHKKYAKIDTYADEWNTKLTERKSKSNQIKELKSSLAKKEVENENWQEQVKKSKAALKTEDEHLTPIKKQLEKLTSQLKASNAANLTTQQQQLNFTLNALTQGIQIADKSKLQANKKNVLDLKIKELLKREKVAEKALEKAEALLKAAGNAVTDQEKIIQQELKIIALEKQRNQLVKGEPCSLCGSREHPLVDHYKKLEASDSEQTLIKRKAEEASLVIQKNEELVTLTTLQTQLTNDQVDLGEVKEELEKLKVQFEGLDLEVGLEQQIELKDLHTLRSNELNKLLVKIKEERILQQEKNELAERVQGQEKSVSDLEKTVSLTQEKIEANQTQQKVELKKQKELEEETEAIVQELQKQLSLFDIDLPDIEETEQFLDQIKRQLLLFDEQKLKGLSIKNEIEKLTLSHQNILKAEKEKNKELGEATTQFKALAKSLLKIRSDRKLILPLSTTTEEKREALKKAIAIEKKNFTEESTTFQSLKTAVASLTEAIKTLEKENKGLKLSEEELIKKLDSQMTVLGYQSREELETVLLSEEELKALNLLKERLSKKEVELNALKAKFVKDRGELEAVKNTEESEDELRRQLEEIGTRIDQMIERSGRIQNQFELDNQIRERNSAVIERITTQETVLEKWTELMGLLGGSKDRFNTYVQRLTLQNLIHLANIHLFKLNKRYSLSLPEIYKPGEDLNFLLVDHYQTDELRLVDTSSGGEKFIISLALALGLSDLASNNVHIGSLFIDEGFGTLDNNTLETVIATLETLQAQGKMIGIISHVENLKERIPTQIKVVKKSNGVSEVEIV